MHKVTIQELTLDGKEVNISLEDKLIINICKNTVHSKVRYFTGRRRKVLFGLFSEDETTTITPEYSNFDDWKLSYQLDADHTTQKIKKMGVAGAVGFAVAGPVGAAGAALLANGEDVPIILKSNKHKITAKGKAKASLIKEIEEKEFFASTK